MAYVSDWESLSDAAKRVMAASGLPKDEVQRDICRAIADEAIQFRAKPRWHPLGRLGPQSTILHTKDFQLRTGIHPEDLDWENSRSLKPWMVRRSAPVYFGEWELERIELFVPDVIRVFCRAGQSTEAVAHAAGKASTTTRKRPAFERVERAIQELFPVEVPDQAILPNRALCQRVEQKLRELRLPVVSSDTILRAAGRRK